MKVRFSPRILPLVHALIRKGEVKALKRTQPRERPGAVAALALLGLAGLVVCSVLGIIGFPETALATSPSGFSSVVLGPALLDEVDVKTHTDQHKVMIKTWGLSDVYVVSNTVSVGGYSGWHTHPGPSLVIVKSGTATFYDGDDPTCTPKVVPAGESVVDIGGGHVHMVRNEGSVQLELVAFQIVPQGATRRIDAPDPGYCSF
jgi:quercetin dioxygenase-like cupin family protein